LVAAGLYITVLAANARRYGANTTTLSEYLNDASLRIASRLHDAKSLMSQFVPRKDITPRVSISLLMQAVLRYANRESYLSQSTYRLRIVCTFSICYNIVKFCNSIFYKVKCEMFNKSLLEMLTVGSLLHMVERKYKS
jgi:hypothetical protein